MKSALIVIDAQKIYTENGRDLYCKDAATTIQNINKLISRFVEEKLPIIFVRHVHKQDGSDLGRMFDFTGEPEEDFNFKEGSEDIEYDPHLKLPQQRVEIVKNRYSAFIGTKLNEILAQSGVGSVVVCGFMTNFCCESTTRDAHDRDYFVDFVIDATGTPGTENMSQAKVRSVVKELLESGFARVERTEKFLKNF